MTDQEDEWICQWWGYAPGTTLSSKERDVYARAVKHPDRRVRDDAMLERAYLLGNVPFPVVNNDTARRDQFAMSALTGILYNNEVYGSSMASALAKAGGAEWLAKAVFSFADAMIEARKK